MPDPVIELPWPPRELSPNARVHWAKKSKMAKAYREVCRLMTLAYPIVGLSGEIIMHIEFVPPDRRARDDDNCLSSFKAGRDGVADALGINDNRFKTQLSLSNDPIKGGLVRVKLIEAES